MGARKRAQRPRLSLLSILTIALGIVVLAGTGWVLMVDDPLGGEPRAVAAIENAAPGAPAPIAGNRTPGVDPAKAKGRTITIIDGRSGDRREIVVGPGDREPDIVASIPQRGSGVDPALVEFSRHGPIPKIGADGKRPLDRYAAAALGPDKAPGPAIAIVIGGLGIGTAATDNAIKQLPAGITFAFAPYGADTPKSAGRARAKGHEILLQIPMEPDNYPDNDPGPQTLVTALTSEQNLDRLHWLLSRLHGYVGVTTLMGARFVTSEAALSPVLRDIASRGLLYLDDGTEPKSAAPEIAGAIQAPFLKADLVLDAKASWSDIDDALSKLEAIAAERGSAVGLAELQTVSIERIARWAKAAEARGIRIVPLSAILTRTKQRG
jgi:polysaccharide deacetylase 2 family uncharacterized protein YibQ